MKTVIDKWESRLESYKKMRDHATERFKEAEVQSVQQEWKIKASKYETAIFLCSQVLVDFR